MEAFGPFAETQVIDFRELRDHSFFLIHEADGAGKSSILEAICFALFGTGSGGGYIGPGLRSHHAPPSALTKVSFDFSLGGDSFRVERVPEQETLAIEGTGSTRVGARGTLWKRTGQADDADDGTPLATTWKQVTEEIQVRLGLNHEQFRQVVILPLGHLQRLLLASPKERLDILETLFHTTFFGPLEQGRQGEAHRLSMYLEQLQTRRLPPFCQSNLPARNGLDELETIIMAERDALGRDLATARLEETAALEALETGRRQDQACREEAAAATHLAGLESRSEEYAVLKTRLARARLAVPLEPLAMKADQRSREAANLEAALCHARSERERAFTNLDNRTAALLSEQNREPEREAAAREVKRRQQLRGLSAGLRQARENQARLVAHHQAAQRELDRCHAEQIAIEARATELQKERLSVAATAAQLPTLRREVDHLERRCRRLEELAEARRRQDEARNGVSRAERSRTQAEHAFQAARQVSETMERAWSDAQRPILAGMRVPDRPCPTCESTSQPTPGIPDDHPPPEEDVQQARSDLRKSEQERTDAEHRVREARLTLTQAETAVLALLAETGDGPGPEATGAAAPPSSLSAPDGDELTFCRRDLADRRARAVAAEAAAGRQKALEDDHQDLLTKRQNIQTRMFVAQAAVLEAEKALAEDQAVIDERAKGLPPDTQDEQALEVIIGQAERHDQELDAALRQAQEAHIAAGQRHVAAEAAVKSAEQTLTAGQAALAEIRRDLGRRRQEAGLTDDAVFAAAREDIARIDTWEMLGQRFANELAAARERLARARQVRGDGPSPDPAALANAFTVAKRRVEALAHRESLLQERLTRLRQARRDLATGEADKARSAEESRVAARLADVAADDHPHRPTLRRFMVEALLDEVFIDATIRLQLMSRGRFALRWSRTAADAGDRSGLELELVDSHTDTFRPVDTLSGMEGFMAPLALAFGLANVVQAFAGGSRLETVFVDEGFDRLDGDALDRAVATLREQQPGGTLVGIISHVPELRERIAARLEVTAGRRGSSARFVFG